MTAEDLVVQDENYMEFDKGIQLPKQAQRIHGCANCAWRDMNLCPYGFKSGTGHHLRKNSHANGICDKRKHYLAGFSREGAKQPSYTQWAHDYKLVMANVVYDEDYTKLRQIELKLMELKEKGIPDTDKDIKTLKAEQKHLRNDWFNLWKELMKAESDQLNRETPKKIDITETKRLSLTDIHDLMRDEVDITAEVEVEDDKNI